jgi:hypothetical protein
MHPLTRLVVLPLIAAPAFALEPLKPKAILDAQTSADRTALLEQVESIATGGVVGTIHAVGPGAFAVIAGAEGKNTHLPIAAAARWEKGRVVAFGHNGFLAPESDPGTARLLANAMRWATAGAPKVKIAVRKKDALVAHFKSAGFDAGAVEGDDWAERLAGFGGLAVDAHAIGVKDVAPLAKWLRGGGGIVTAATGWGWQQTHAQQKLATDFPGNRLLGPAGLVWGTETVDGTAGKKAFAANATDPMLSSLNASTALDALAAAGKSPLSDGEVAQIGTTLMSAARALPPDDQTLLPRLVALRTLPGANEFPRPDKPLPASSSIARLALANTIELIKQAKPEQLRAHPAAESFPGAVRKDAPRVQNRAVTIDPGVRGWQGTGLYAAPGELIRVVVPPELIGKDFRVRIGCHKDTLWHHDKWQRVPEITLTFPIAQAETRAANPFGGPVYIEVPDKLASGKSTLAISGAVEAPRFILGQTTLADWRARLSKAPAPWAELETKKIIWSVPSERIRSLNDPEALMKFWDRIMDAQADLATIPHDRARPERIVADTQISAGYMHAGYPIMVPLDSSTERALTLRDLQEGSWGHFHELGHNHQAGDWTFDGTGEVTCNLFSLYCMETLCGQPPGEGHDAMKPEAVEKRLRGYLGMGDKFTRWKSDPFLALIMYHQLRVGFGWETYKKVFAEYRDLPKDQRPKNDDEKRDQWLVRFSRASGKNLGPFFEAWGVPTSSTARDSIKELPGWMPKDWPRQ